jgi:hypothetical protein
MRIGASRLATLLSVGMVCGSLYWIGFSSRVLTEIPGAVLLIWLFWAVEAEKDRPRRTLVVAVFTVVYCFFMHLRFAPLGLLGGAFYGLAILVHGGSWTSRALRLGIFALIVLAGLGVWFAVQRHLFTGPSQPVGDVLMSYPCGIWQILVDRFGAGAGLFPIYTLMAAQVIWWQRDRRHRLLQTGLTTTVIACAVVNCSNTWPFVSFWDCMPGRYLFAAVPLMIPALAVVLSTATQPAVVFCVFLCLTSVAGTAFYFHILPALHSMGHPLMHFTTHTALLGFLMPFAKFDEPSTVSARNATLLFAVCLMVSSYILLRIRVRNWTPIPVLCLIAIVATAMIAHRAQQFDRSFDPSQVAEFMRDIDRRHIQVQRPSSNTTLPLTSLMNGRLRNPYSTTNEPLTISTANLGFPHTNNAVSLPQMPRTDWRGRPLQWAPLVCSFKADRGDWLLQAKGSVTGRVEAIQLAVVKDSKSYWEGAWITDVSAWQSVITLDERGDFQVFARIKGDGAWRIESMQWFPWSREWPLDNNITFSASKVQPPSANDAAQKRDANRAPQQQAERE